MIWENVTFTPAVYTTIDSYFLSYNPYPTNLLTGAGVPDLTQPERLEEILKKAFPWLISEFKCNRIEKGGITSDSFIRDFPEKNLLLNLNFFQTTEDQNNQKNSGLCLSAQILPVKITGGISVPKHFNPFPTITGTENGQGFNMLWRKIFLGQNIDSPSYGFCEELSETLQKNVLSLNNVSYPDLSPVSIDDWLLLTVEGMNIISTRGLLVFNIFRPTVEKIEAGVDLFYAIINLIVEYKDQVEKIVNSIHHADKLSVIAGNLVENDSQEIMKVVETMFQDVNELTSNLFDDTLWDLIHRYNGLND